jgi:hypothetical protein
MTAVCHGGEASKSISLELPMKIRRTAERVMFLGSLLALGVMLGFALPLCAQTTTPIFVELNPTAPTVPFSAGGVVSFLVSPIGSISSDRQCRFNWSKSAFLPDLDMSEHVRSRLAARLGIVPESRGISNDAGHFKSFFFGLWLCSSTLVHSRTPVNS